MRASKRLAWRWWLLLLAAVLGAGVLAGCGGGKGRAPAAPPLSSLIYVPNASDGVSGGADVAAATRAATADGIDVQAVLLAPGMVPELPAPVARQASGLDPARDAVIWLQFDTHAGDLNVYDVRQGVRLAVGGEQRLPSAWLEEDPGGHHRWGLLVFTGPVDGPLALHVSRLVAGPELVLTWDD